MRFARVGPAGSERPVVIVKGETYDLRPLTPDIDGSFLADSGIERVRTSLAGGDLPSTVIGNERIGPPIARPSAVICVGMNYAAHAAESGATPPEVPIIFLKTPNTIVGPYDRVTIPKGSTKTDWEVELGVVMGKRASYLESAHDAGPVIAGYAVANDVSERDFQLAESGGQWSKGKCAAGFNPLGPWLVPADEVAADNLRLRSWVNGESRQDSSTADMIFNVETIVWHLSQYMVLEPGDLILTGTPEGVALSGRFPYLTNGDIVEVDIDGLGRQRQEFVRSR